jgi:hypothetical protein
LLVRDGQVLMVGCAGIGSLPCQGSADGVARLKQVTQHDDDIEARPDKARNDILTYVGADPAKDSGALAAGHNRKAKSEKLTLTDEIRGVLVDHFADEVRECARLFGGQAKEWPARYGL